jgi:hypothetical protein
LRERKKRARLGKDLGNAHRLYPKILEVEKPGLCAGAADSGNEFSASSCVAMESGEIENGKIAGVHGISFFWQGRRKLPVIV